ncbi:MAG: ABC transporter permease [Clostridium sp.]|nr:ABC transporter permease [Clostridium sp.]
MNIVNKLTLRHLKENKGRTLVTTLGICVSVAMITAVFVAMASFLQLFGDVEYMAGGHKDAVLYADSQQLQQLKRDDRIKAVGVESELYDTAYQLEKRKSDSAGIGSIYSGDTINLKQCITGDYDGVLPKNDKEIAVEQSLIENNELDWKIGDIVTIPVGTRYVVDNGVEAPISYGSFSGGEKFRVENIGEYKITAILYNNPATMGYKIIRGLDLNALELKGDDVVAATIQLEKVDYKSLDVIRDIIKQYKIEEYNINTDYLETKFAIDENSSIVTSILPLILIVLIIIVIASVVLIYNAFGMSVSERVRYLGMLASVGATRKQKKLSVYYEGFILGAVGIPVGILAGIAGIGITLKAVGSKIVSTGMIQGVSDSNLNMQVVIPLWAIIGIVLFSVLTIFISSFVPSKKASAVTPIDAIAQRQEIKVKAKRLKSPKIIRTIFGYEGELAYKNLNRNGRKARVITASIALSVILFLSCNYFCQLFMQSVQMEAEAPYQVITTVLYSDKDKFLSELDDVSNVDRYYSVINNYNALPEDDGEPDSEQNLTDKNYLTSTYKRLFNSKNHFYVNYIDDDAFNALCEKNNIDYKEYYGDTLKAVMMNNINHKENTAKVFNDKILGAEYYNIKITGLVDYDKDNYVCNLNAKNCISAFAPQSSYFKLMFNDEELSQMYYSVGIETGAHEQVAEDIFSLLGSNGFDEYSCQDIVDSLQVMNTLVFIIQVFVYGFISLISLITVANIINTISTGIAMRRKEFAMLKSVGTTPKGFNKMIALESAFYGMKALIFALPISVLISFGMNRVMGFDSMPFEINWILYLIITAVVLLIVGVTMLYSVNKLKHDSIVETLKEEIN